MGSRNGNLTRVSSRTSCESGEICGGTPGWAQLVEVSAQVMITWVVRLSHTSGFLLSGEWA